MTLPLLPVACPSPAQFLYLKLIDHSDKGKDANENRHRGVRHASDNDTRVAAQQLGGAIGKLHIQHDDVRFGNAPCGRPANDVPTFENVTDGMAWKYAEHWQMLVAQVYNLKWCGDAIDEYTRATGVRFDQVIKSRPDVAFADAIDPHCKARRSPPPPVCPSARPASFARGARPPHSLDSLTSPARAKAATGSSCCRARSRSRACARAGAASRRARKRWPGSSNPRRSACPSPRA